MPSRPPRHRPQRANLSDPRPSADERGYNAHWQRLRLAYLACHPLCQTPGCNNEARHVDHVRSLARGGTHDEGNLQALCASCHSRKTILHDGGCGRPRKPY